MKWNIFKKKKKEVLQLSTVTSTITPQTITWNTGTTLISRIGAATQQQALIQAQSQAWNNYPQHGMQQYNQYNAQAQALNSSHYMIFQDKVKLEAFLEPLSSYKRAEFFINLKNNMYYHLGYNLEEEFEKWEKILEKKKHNNDFNDDLKEMLNG